MQVKNLNELMSKKYKKVCRIVNYFEHLVILISAVTGCDSIFSFFSLVSISVVATSSVVGLKICVITGGI